MPPVMPLTSAAASSRAVTSEALTLALSSHTGRGPPPTARGSRRTVPEASEPPITYIRGYFSPEVSITIPLPRSALLLYQRSEYMSPTWVHVRVSGSKMRVVRVPTLRVVVPPEASNRPSARVARPAP